MAKPWEQGFTSEEAAPSSKPWEMGFQPMEEGGIDSSQPQAQTDTFKTKLAEVENSVKSGWDEDKGLWFSHKSLEGGTPTLGYGYKLTKGEVDKGEIKLGDDTIKLGEGLTESQADQLLDQSIEEAGRRVKRDISDYDALDEKYQKVLINIAFNVGNVEEKSWPNLLKAMRDGDDAKVREEMLTSYKKEDGTVVKLKERRDAIADSLGIK